MMTNPNRDRDLAETRKMHRIYWRKLMDLHRDTVDLILNNGSGEGDTARQGAIQICELLAKHNVFKAIEQAKFLANYAGNEAFFHWVVGVLENYQETLPESESQAVSIIFNLAGKEHIAEISGGTIPENCSNALIFLSGRRVGFILERMEANLVTVTKAMETEGE